MSEEDARFQFTHDLAANARLHVLFLRTVHAAGVSLRRPSPSHVRRYRDLWLPLVARHGNKGDVANTNGEKGGGLVPPIDVAWLWHCHRLSPYNYLHHVRSRFGEDAADPPPIYLDADPPFALQHPDQDESTLSAAALSTRKLWRKTYPDEPFFLDIDRDENDRLHAKEVGKDRDSDGTFSGFDLLGSTDRQATFLWQVEQHRFRDESFLLEGVRNYKKFLRLRRTAGGRSQIIVPTYQIDLIWHTHILSSLRAYEADCRSILGGTLHHDDSLNDRTVGATLDVAFRATKELWAREYGTDYVVPGGMYRGEPPEEYFHPEWGARQMLDEDAAAERQRGEKKVHSHLLLVPVGGRIMGASSTMKEEVPAVMGTLVEDIAPAADNPGPSPTMTPCWVEPSGTAPDGKPGFLAAVERSKVRGINNNPKMDDYIFGKGPLGHGYYHISTKDAYIILISRVDKRIRSKETEADCLSCSACICPCSGSRALETKAREEINDLNEVRAILYARSRADVPLGVVGLPDSITKDPTEKERVNRYYDDHHGWLFPTYFYDAGGGCGGVIDDLGWGGGGCGGGGACGAGACGGGGCGGGGCGGGGCGG